MHLILRVGGGTLYFHYDNQQFPFMILQLIMME
jgi:hypothetical protein